MRRPHLGSSTKPRLPWRRPAHPARGRAFCMVVQLLAISALAMLLAGRPSVDADATCNVPPVNLSSALGEDDASVVLTWEASGECTPDEYAVYRRDMDVAGARMTKIVSVDGDTLTYTDSTVTAGQHYRYRIRSNDLGSRSGRTDITIPEAAVSELTPEPEPVIEEADRSLRQEPDFDNTAPLLLAANVDGTSLVLIYSELLNESSTPAGSDFTVDIGGTDYTPSSVAVLGAEVELTLSTGAASGDTVTLDYTVGTNPVEDPAGNDVQALTSWSVTNHTGATNDRPEFASDTVTLTVDENTASLTAFGDPVAAADDDTADTLTYQLHSTVVPTFFIDTSTGQVSVFGNLDFETTSTYVAPMYVRDSKSPAGDADSAWDDSIKVTISVNDLNEKPSIEDPDISTHPENTAIVATYTVDDEDSGDSHTWSVESDTSLEGNKDGALF
ncbi:MAG: SwmB domain-containing protein [Chloroflexota bacterium]|nr:SwmB domain-containing protein [Chloroflexota bacterium]MDE2894020.1 SwmB domain-containing protein [Chloroflexota bacterium]